MLETGVALAILAGVVGAVGLYWLTHGFGRVAFANPRKERLTRRLAEAVDCSLARVLPAVQREIAIDPNQADETLLKRALYHYQLELPGHTYPITYQDRTPG